MASDENDHQEDGRDSRMVLGRTVTLKVGYTTEAQMVFAMELSGDCASTLQSPTMEQ
jgi:hypothetical protein